MKFDMGRAWDDATGLLRRNTGLVALIAGVFILVPNCLFMMQFLDLATMFENPRMAQNPELVSNAFAQFFADNWWALVLTVLGQAIGMLAIIILLSDRGRPTTGAAIGDAAKLALPSIAASLLMYLAFTILILLPVMIGGGLQSVAVAIILVLPAIVAICYLFAKFSLVQAVFGIERTFNPVAALARSWRLTKGNSLLLFLFFFLLWFAFAIVSQVVSLFVSLILALVSAEAAMFGNALISSAIGAGYAALTAAVMVSAYRQLSGEPKAELAQTFD